MRISLVKRMMPNKPGYQIAIRFPWQNSFIKKHAQTFDEVLDETIEAVHAVHKSPDIAITISVVDKHSKTRLFVTDTTEGAYGRKQLIFRYVGPSGLLTPRQMYLASLSMPGIEAESLIQKATQAVAFFLVYKKPNAGPSVI